MMLELFRELRVSKSNENEPARAWQDRSRKKKPYAMFQEELADTMGKYAKIEKWESTRRRVAKRRPMRAT